MSKKNIVKNKNKFENKEFSGLSSVFEFFPYPFYIINVHDYSIAYTNIKVEGSIAKDKLFCYSLSHGFKNPCSGISHICPINDIMRTRKKVVLEHIHKDKNGKDIAVRVVAYPIFNKEKNIIQIAEYHIDTREEKNDKKLLAKSEAILSSIVNSIQDVIFIKDKNLKYTDINTVAEKYFGKEKSKLVGLDDLDLFSKKETRQIKQIDKRVLSGETIKEEVLRIINKEERIFQKTKTPLLSRDGEIIGVCGIAHDITDSKKREMELKNINRINKDILENSPVGMFVTNKEGGVIYVNKKMIEISGSDYDSFVSINFLKHAPYKKAGLIDKIKDCFLGHKFRMEAIKYTSLTGGKETIRNFIGLPVGEGDSRNVLIIVEDITEIEKKKKDLEKRNKELETFNKIAVNRELKMIELKKEIKRLKKDK